MMHTTAAVTPANDADLAGARLRTTAGEITWLLAEARELLGTPIAERDGNYERRRAAFMARKQAALEKADST